MFARDPGVSAELTAATPRGRARTDLAALFAHVGLASPDLDARLLVCAACGIDHAGLIRDPDLPLCGVVADILTELAARRLARVPISRILGQREFWGLPFKLGPDLLDPRPETEGVVAAALDAIGGRRDAPLRLLDLGTGSGAILCALLHELPGAFGVGIDRSASACRSARANAASLGLAGRAAFACAYWGEALTGRDGFDLVVSNPPYIPSDDLAGLDPEVRLYDPLAALDGGADGLDAYRIIAPALARLLRPAGVAVLECGQDQGPAVSDLLATALTEIRVLKDLAGLDRVVVGVKRPIGAASECRYDTVPGRSRASSIIWTKTLGVGRESA